MDENAIIRQIPQTVEVLPTHYLLQPEVVVRPACSYSKVHSKTRVHPEKIGLPVQAKTLSYPTIEIRSRLSARFQAYDESVKKRSNGT